MSRQNQNFKTLAEKKQEFAIFKAKWEEMKEKEKNLKEQFYSSPFSERARIKRELSSLQKTMFDKKWSCGKSTSIDIRNEEMIQRLKNPTGEATDPHLLANQIKGELQTYLSREKEIKEGERVGDIWEASQGEEICYFGDKLEIKEAIANLARNRQKPLDPEKITSRMVRVKRSDFSTDDFNELISLIRQVRKFLEEKDKQDRQRTENIKLNNPHLFTQWKCSTDGKYNGRGRWEDWHTFSGKHRGFNYTIYVPDEHLALTNVLFDDGWGTNSEVSKFFVVEGAVKPTTLHYWNVAKQRDEIVSEVEAQRLIKQDKENYIGYETYVGLNDEIMISHYDEKSDKLELAKPVSGVNKELVENSDRLNMGRGLITNEMKKDKTSEEIDN